MELKNLGFMEGEISFSSPSLVLNLNISKTVAVLLVRKNLASMANSS